MAIGDGQNQVLGLVYWDFHGDAYFWNTHICCKVENNEKCNKYLSILTAM